MMRSLMRVLTGRDDDPSLTVQYRICPGECDFAELQSLLLYVTNEIRRERQRIADAQSRYCEDDWRHALSDFDIERDVQRGRRMGQCAGRNDVHTGFSDRGDGFQRHAA